MYMYFTLIRAQCTKLHDVYLSQLKPLIYISCNQKYTYTSYPQYKYADTVKEEVIAGTLNQSGRALHIETSKLPRLTNPGYFRDGIFSNARRNSSWRAFENIRKQ